MSTKRLIIRTIISLALLFIGGLLALGLFLPTLFEVCNDYQIIYCNTFGKSITVYARGERKGLLGQHEAIIFSPENIASRKWTYDSHRDLRYNGEDYVLIKIEDGVLHVYSRQILSNVDFSSWEIPVIQETLETKRKILVQEDSKENGYSIISVKDMTE